MKGNAMFNDKEMKYLNEIGKCDECFNQVVKKFTKDKHNSLFWLNQK